MYRKALNTYLRAVGYRLGKKLSLDSNGICVLQRDNDSANGYVIELPADSQVVYFYAPVCRVPYGCTEEFFEKVLEYNLCGVMYNQATFGLDPKTQNIVISYTRSMELLDEVALTNIVVNFIKTADRARANLRKLVDALSEMYLLDDDETPQGMSQLQAKVNVNKLKA